MPKNYSAHSSGFMPQPIFPVPAWDWRPFSGSFGATAAGFQHKEQKAGERRFRLLSKLTMGGNNEGASDPVGGRQRRRRNADDARTQEEQYQQHDRGRARRGRGA